MMPLVIGGVGGSGTRIPAEFAQEAGVQLGETNYALDARAFVWHDETWMHLWLAGPLPAAGEEAMTNSWQICLKKHIEGLDLSRPWGWKSPRSVLNLRFLHKQLPDMRFVHIVRNGLDMACSPNENQPSRYADLVSLASSVRKLTWPEQRIAYWAEVNKRAADYGESMMGDGYFRIRYEDLLAGELAPLLAFINQKEATPALMARCLRKLKPPGTVGRWRETFSLRQADPLAALAGGQLERFGYNR